MSTTSKPPAASTATITLTIGTYNNTGSGSFCTISGSTATGDTRVVASSQSPYTVTVTPQKGNSTPLNLEFVAQGPTAGNGTTDYQVVGVFFSGTNGSSIFSTQSGAPAGSVVVQDAFSNKGSWEFVLLVKQVLVSSEGVRTSSIGVIDPPIDNHPEG